MNSTDKTGILTGFPSHCFSVSTTGDGLMKKSCTGIVQKRTFHQPIKKGLQHLTVTPYFIWWAVRESNAKPTD